MFGIVYESGVIWYCLDYFILNNFIGMVYFKYFFFKEILGLDVRLFGVCVCEKMFFKGG